jgi:enoyl-CoA hydratase/carnithine racemase
VRPDELTDVRYSVDEGVALVELHRPERGNAWGGRMAVEYRWALHWADRDPDARVVVVTGAGRSFCVGADLQALDAIGASGGSYRTERVPPAPWPEETPADMRRNHAYPLSLSVPVIAALNGSVAGAGFVVATYADLRVAATDTKVVTSFAALGVPAEYGIGWVLPRLMGTARALQLLYHPGPLTGTEAAELGWVQQVAPAGAALDEALALARRLAHDCSPRSLRTMKRAVAVDAWGSFDAAYTRSVEDMDANLASSEFRDVVASRRAGRAHDFLAPSATAT